MSLPKQYRQQYVEFMRHGITFHSVVIAKIDTHALHIPASAYLLAKALEGSSKNTLISYASVIKSLLEEVEFDGYIRDIDDLTDNHISQYLEIVLFRERGLSAKSIDFHIVVLKAWFEWCYESGHSLKPERFSYYVNQEIKLQLKKEEGRRKSLDPYKLYHKYIPHKEFEELLKFEPSSGDFITRRNEIILRLGYQVGLRASEVVTFNHFTLNEIQESLQVADKKNMSGFEIDVIGKGSNGGKVRTVYVPDDLKRKIQRFINSYSYKLKHRHLICSQRGTELNSTFASKVFRDAKKNLVASANKEISDRWENLPLRSFHSLRHSYATNLARRIYTGDANERIPRILLQERLGHAHASTTAIYIHFSACLYQDHLEIQNECADVIQNNPTDRE